MFLLLAFKNLFRNLRRTIAILLTIALGAGALFSFDGFINGVLTQYRDNTIHAHYGFGQVNIKGYRDSIFEEPWKHWITNQKEVEGFLLGLEEVEKVFPRLSFSALLTNGSISVSGLGQGIDAAEEADFFHSLNVEEGETLSTQPNGILIGKGLAKTLDVKPGDKIIVIANSVEGGINKIETEVAGIFHTGSLDFDGRIFRIQLNEAQKLLKTKNVELISLGLKHLSDWEKVAEKVQTAFPNLEATSFEILDSVYYGHSVNWLHAQFHVVEIIILAILLLGIFNTISAAILERKQEIGNLRANGESSFGVMKLVVLEGAFLGLLGGLIGIGLSFSILKIFFGKGILMPPGPGLTKQFFASFSFQWSMVLFTLNLSLIASIVASILAGFRVAKMPIAKALRSH